MANVTFGEVAEHLKKRLQLDDEWVVEVEDSLIWHSWFLKHGIYVMDEGVFDDSDNWIRIGSELRVLETDEENGLALCHEWNRRYHQGVFMWDEGWVWNRASFSFNPLNRSMLNFFHQLVLIQNTLSHLMAALFAKDDRMKISEYSHPSSGVRYDPDELLGIYWGEKYKGEIFADYEEALGNELKLLGEMLLSRGFEKGFSDEGVTFYFDSRFTFAFGRISDSEEELRFGPGIRVMQTFTDFPFPATPEYANSMNLFATNPFGKSFSQFGPFSVTSDSDIAGLSSSIVTYVDYATLAEERKIGGNIANLLFNISTHAFMPWNAVRSEIERGDQALSIDD